MVQVSRLSRRARWAVPAGALVITGGVMAGALISVAQAAPGLPARTPAQLLADVADSATPPLTGTVVETSSFGLPALPATGNPTSLSSLLTGSHTVRVWYSSPGHFRLAVPESLSESDVIRDGSTAWLWQSTLNKVTKFTLPAHSAARPSQAVPKQPLTPQQAAQQVLAAVGPTTTVSVASNVTVAGQAAYALVLAPKDARSLIGQVQIDIDGRNSVPLRLQVFARGASSPAFQVGYTAIQFVTPAPADLSFTPPPGATVTQVNLASGGREATGNASSGVSSIGSGWLTVLKLPSSALTPGAPAPGSSAGPGGDSSAGDSSAVLGAVLASATPVHGAWGTGRLLRTSLVSVLMTDQGSTFVGAVQPSVLYAAAASGASAGDTLTAISTSGLTKRFRGGQLAVDHIDLAVSHGSVYGFLGPNGSGKTTTIRMLLGLAFPTEGQAALLEVPMPAGATQVLHRVGSLVEGPAFYPFLTGLDNLARYDAADRTADPRTARARIEEALDRVGLLTAAKKRYRNYSLGMKQRLAIAAGLLRPRELIILDEPTNGLDPQGTREVRALIRQIATDGTTVFVSSHLLAEVEQICTHVGVMRTGRLVFQGSLPELRRTGAVRVTVQTADPEAAAKVLTGLGLADAQATKAEVSGDAQPEASPGATPQVTALLGDASPEQVCAELVHAGIGVRGFAVTSPSLEDLFVGLTGEGFDVGG